LITVKKLNESFSVIDSDTETLKDIFNFLKVKRPNSYFDPMVRSGFKSPYDYFASIQDNKLLIMNGHIQLLYNFGIEYKVQKSNYSKEELDKFLNEIKPTLPFELYDFQETAFKESILNVKQINKMCTGCLSGDSEIEIFSNDFTDEELKSLLESI
jgi:hypothetical protein